MRKRIKTSEWHTDPDLGNVLLSAIRYALPRQTGIITNHIGFTKKHWQSITPYWRKLILHDCEREVICEQQAQLDEITTKSGHKFHWLDPLCFDDVRDFVEWMKTQEAI